MRFIALSATQNITATPGQDTDYYHYKKTKKGLLGTGSSKSITRKSTRQQRAKVTGEQDVSLSAGNNIALIAPSIQATEGDLTLDAQNQILLGTAKDSDYEAIDN